MLLRQCYIKNFFIFLCTLLLFCYNVHIKNEKIFLLTQYCCIYTQYTPVDVLTFISKNTTFIWYTQKFFLFIQFFMHSLWVYNNFASFFLCVKAKEKHVKVSLLQPKAFCLCYTHNVFLFDKEILKKFILLKAFFLKG